MSAAAAAAAATTTDTEMGGGNAASRGRRMVWEMLRQLFESALISYLKPIHVRNRDFEADDILVELRHEAMLQRRHLILRSNRVNLRDAIEAVRALNNDINDYVILKFETDDNNELLRRKMNIIRKHIGQETYDINRAQIHPDFEIDRQIYRTAFLLLDTFISRILHQRVQRQQRAHNRDENRSLRILTTIATTLFTRNAFDSEQQTHAIVNNIVSQYLPDRVDLDALETEVFTAKELWADKMTHISNACVVEVIE
jgi:hypothetical protein